MKLTVEENKFRWGINFFIVERMTAFEICLNHSKLRPAHEYGSQSEVYSEAAGDVPA